jgi:hypothetical protein
VPGARSEPHEHDEPWNPCATRFAHAITVSRVRTGRHHHLAACDDKPSAQPHRRCAEEETVREPTVQACIQFGSDIGLRQQSQELVQLLQDQLPPRTCTFAFPGLHRQASQSSL